MKLNVYYILFSCTILMLVSCASANKKCEIAECNTILLNGVSEISVGETTIIYAVGYDKDNKIIKNIKSIKPQWKIENDHIAVLEKDLGYCIKIKGKNKGSCMLKAIKDDIVTSFIIVVK